jgi:hypothetical protein
VVTVPSASAKSGVATEDAPCSKALGDERKTKAIAGVTAAATRDAGVG